MFSDLLYCANCGKKLYYSVTDNYKREQAYFFCSAYRKTLMCALPTISGKKLWSSFYLRVCRGYYGMCRVTKSYSHKGSWRNLARCKRKSLLKTQKSDPKAYSGLLTKRSRLAALKLSRPNWYTNLLRNRSIRTRIQRRQALSGSCDSLQWRWNHPWTYSRRNGRILPRAHQQKPSLKA